jgi:3-hydroxyisobutyrate dehydrogenase
MAKAAFIGLGVMGYPMAGHLQKNGHEVTVYNRTTAKAEKWAGEYGGSFADTPANAAEGAEFVFSCVGNDDDLRSVVYGDDGILTGMSEGIGFLDGPVSGGQAGAENGKLTVMTGGDADTFAKAKPVIDSYAVAVTLMGEAGSGQITKMVNQICIAGLVQGLSEGLAFAQKAGLDAELVVDCISKGAAGSWQMENRGKTMAQDEFDFGFAVEWMRKDLGIALGESKANGALLPVTALVDQFYGEVIGMGGKRWDTSSLIRRLTRD